MFTNPQFDGGPTPDSTSRKLGLRCGEVWNGLNHAVHPLPGHPEHLGYFSDPDKVLRHATEDSGLG